MTPRTAVRRLMSIAELVADDQPPLMPLLTFTGSILGLADSTAFQYAKEGRLPVEVVRVGRQRYVFTRQVRAWLHLSENGDGPRDATQEPSVERNTAHTS